MRRLRTAVLLLAVAGLTMGVVAPADAAPAEKTTYITGECYSAPPVGTGWTSGEVSHWVGEVQYFEFLYDGHGWTGPIGTQTVQVNLTNNLRQNILTMHGTYTHNSTIGSFAGTWSHGNTTYEHAAGRATDGSGELAKTTMGLDPGLYPPPPFPQCAGWLINEWTIITP